MAYIGKVPADVLVDPLVTSASLVDGTIITADIADDAVTSAKLAANSVDSSELIDGSVDNSHLAGSIAINKTLLAGGTGLTLSTNTLNVDAAQTQITSVGSLTGLTIDASDPTLTLKSDGDGNANTGYVAWQSDDGTSEGWLGYGSTSDSAFKLYLPSGNDHIEFLPNATSALTLTSSSATFAGNAVFNGEVLVNNTSSGNAKLYIKGGGTSTANSLYITDSAGADILYVKDNKSAKFYGTLETVGNATFAGKITQEGDVGQGSYAATFKNTNSTRAGGVLIDTTFNNSGLDEPLLAVRMAGNSIFNVSSNNSATFAGKIVLGDLDIIPTSSNVSVIKHDSGSGSLTLQGDQVNIKNRAGDETGLSYNDGGGVTFAGTINTTGTTFNSTGQNYIFNSEYAMYFNVDSTGGTAERFIFGVGRTGTGGGAEWLTLTNSLATFSPAVKFESEYGDVYRKTRSKRTNGTGASITQDFNLTVAGISSWSGGMLKVRSCGSAANLSTIGYVTNEYRFAQYSGDSFSITAIGDQSNEDNMAVSFPTNSGNDLVIRITWTKNLSGTQGYMASDVDVLFYGGFGSLT